MNGVDVSSSSGIGTIGDGNRNPVSRDATAVNAPLIEVCVGAARNNGGVYPGDIVPASVSIDGDADTIDTGQILNTVDTNSKMRVWFKVIQTGLGDNFSIDINDEGGGNYGGVTYVAFA
jgi:hypothetical protein